MSNPKPPRTPIPTREALPTKKLGATVDSFASRIRRQLRAQEEKRDESSREAEVRRGLILQAMTSIRKALGETSKIDLGPRFVLRNKVSDWEGWPRIELQLEDLQQGIVTPVVLVITADDHTNQGTIFMNTRAGEHLGRINLRTPADVERLALVLRKAVRQFLDSVAQYVLNPAPLEDTARIDLHEPDEADLGPFVKK